MSNFSSPVRASTGRANLVPNPSFELGTTVASTYTGYPANVTVSVNTTAANALRGSNSLQLNGSSTSAAVVWAYAPGLAGAPIVAVSPNTTYTFSFWVRCTQVARNWAASVNYYTAAQTNVGGTLTGTMTATSVSGWTQVSYTTTSPATAASVGLRMVSATNSATEVFYIDGLVLEAAATASSYFDGTYYGGRWRGTAHNSISESYAFDGGNAVIQNIAPAVNANDAATKSYVDTSLASGVRASGVTQRLNLITNPSFTNGTTSGWVANNAAGTVTYTSADSYYGAGAMLVGTTTTATAGQVSTPIAAVTAGTTYTFSFYVKPGSIATSAQCQPRIEWYNASNSLITTSAGGNSGIPSTYGWSRLTLTVAAPANATRANAVIQSTGTVVTDTHMIDAVLFEASPSLNAYFDGSFVGARWQGTASAAISETIAFDANATAIINVAAPTLTTDAANKAYVDAVAAGGSGTLDPDLVTIGNLNPPDDYILQRKASAWTASSPATVKTDLAITKNDVGLSNVDNTSDSAKPVSTAQAAAIAAVAGGSVNDLAMMNIMGVY